ncbi:enoyl-CoA hydratase/isomerase family protein [Arenibacterium sp. CAU 1754]
MIDLSKDDGLWTVTLNRPEKANSVTEAMLAELVQIMQDAQTAKAVILTGTGKVFSAGADLDEVKASGLALSPLWEQLSGAIAALPCLTIAALNGTLAGGSMGMVLASDLRIAAEGANFFYPVMKRGVLPQPSDPVRMSALIGPARTKLILIAGQKVSADEAYQFGLVDRVVGKDDLIEVAQSLAADARAADPAIAEGIANLCAGL